MHPQPDDDAPHQVHRALDIIERTPIDELSLAGEPLPQRHPDVQAGWLTRPTVSAADLRMGAAVRARCRRRTSLRYSGEGRSDGCRPERR